MSQMEALFGELRSMAQRYHTLPYWELRKLLEQAIAIDEDRYRAEWIPYLVDVDKFPYCFGETLDEIAHIANLFPEGPPLILSIEDTRFDYGMMLDAPHLKRLTGINVSYKCNLTDTRFARMMESPYLENVVRLDVGGNKLSDGAMEALAGAKSIQRLEYLRLYHNEINARGAQALAESPLMSHLTELDISVNNIQDAGIAAIGASPHLGNLRKLDAGSNKIKRKGAEDFAKTTTLVNLTNLSLGQNNIGNYGAQALADCPALSNLTTLSLGRARVNDKGLAFIRSSPHLTKLENLYNH